MKIIGIMSVIALSCVLSLKCGAQSALAPFMGDDLDALKVACEIRLDALDISAWRDSSKHFDKVRDLTMKIHINHCIRGDVESSDKSDHTVIRQQYADSEDLLAGDVGNQFHANNLYLAGSRLDAKKISELMEDASAVFIDIQDQTIRSDVEFILAQTGKSVIDKETATAIFMQNNREEHGARMAQYLAGLVSSDAGKEDMEFRRLTQHSLKGVLSDEGRDMFLTRLHRLLRLPRSQVDGNGAIEVFANQCIYILSEVNTERPTKLQMDVATRYMKWLMETDQARKVIRRHQDKGERRALVETTESIIAIANDPETKVAMEAFKRLLADK